MRTRGSRGLSLIEVLIAFAVLTVAVLALMGLLPAAASQSASTDLQNQALLLAEHKMDEILAGGVFIGSSPLGSPDAPLPEVPGLQRTWSGSPDPGGDPNLQLIAVEITWVEQARPRRVRLVSLLAR
ncbi:MAG: prepilin-type N-terminal cleavage/methylation domain-containing protein [Armatimonadetes bacterium]|nr:prepilin-type N-terminal cleavage/methylation domain-containing protein [Armatimonadota bacterium]